MYLKKKKKKKIFSQNSRMQSMAKPNPKIPYTMTMTGQTNTNQYIPTWESWAGVGAGVGAGDSNRKNLKEISQIVPKSQKVPVVSVLWSKVQILRRFFFF